GLMDQPVKPGTFEARFAWRADHAGIRRQRRGRWLGGKCRERLPAFAVAVLEADRGGEIIDGRALRTEAAREIALPEKALRDDDARELAMHAGLRHRGQLLPERLEA